MQIDIGHVGAKRTSFSEHNLRDLLRKVQAAHPEATEESLRDLLRDEVLSPGNAGYVLTCVDYAVANTVKAVLKPRRKTARAHHDGTAAAAAAAKRETTKSTVVKRVVEQAKILLLDMVLPNGLALRDCTGSDCRSAGGWLVKVADQVGDRKVGEVLDEGKLRGFFAADTKEGKTTP